jgi:hypothetical protein
LGRFSTFYRWITDAEIRAFSSAGSYAISGTWRSPKIFANNTEVEAIVLGYSNVSASGYISQLQVLNASDNSVLWTDLWPSPITSHTDNITYADVPADILVSADGVRVKVFLAGDGAHTPYVFLVGVVFEEVESPTSVIPTAVSLSWDSGIWIFIFLLLAYVVLLIIAWYDDSVAWFIPAGIVMQLIAFQGWTVTSSLPVAISLSVVGIVTLLVPIGHALRGKPS